MILYVRKKVDVGEMCVRVCGGGGGGVHGGWL